MEPNWHSLKISDVVSVLGSDIEKGLTQKEVKEKQERFGKNVLPEEKPASRLRIFLEQLRSPLIYILIIGGVMTLFLKEYRDSIIIFSAVLINAVLGFVQEYKASKTLKALKKIVRHEARARRDGRLKIIDSTELVPGDIVVLYPGDRVPADGRIIESRDLKINEMILTGEWMPAQKKSGVLSEETPLADRDNMVFTGCAIEDGSGKILVTDTGINTEIGKIVKLLKESREEKTPYQRKLHKFAKIIGLIVILICVAIFMEGVFNGGNLTEMFILAVAVAVAAIPEGLPVAMTVILALGMQRIFKKKGLVRRLSSAETLGSTSIICTDKTGTLTEGKMKVGEAIAFPDESLEPLLFKIGVVCTESFIENPKDLKSKWIIRGRPTDRALLSAGAEQGFDKDEIKRKEPLLDTVPFSPEYKFSASLHQTSEKETTLYALGAPEIIMAMSGLKDNIRKEAHEKLEELAEKGLRVVACAFKTEKAKERIKPLIKEMETAKDLVFAGFITLEDPIRRDVKDAIDICKQAGIRPILVTGDHKSTAKAVAKELGFIVEKESLIEGKDLDKLSDDEFGRKIENFQIYARVEPKHKMRIVEMWQKKGEVVAMTGDGVNDAPALKKSDIGVALGSGTEVAKESSDLVLLNDSFSIIVAAVKEGRSIIDNMRKVITYLLSDSFTESILVGVSIFMGFPLPVTAVQILWVNLIEDGLPDIALAFEPKEKDLMRRKPMPRKSPLLNYEMKIIIFIIGIVTGVLRLGIFFWLYNKMNYPLEYLRTIIFALLAFDSISYVFSCKSLRRNIWKTNIFDNKFLLIAWFVGVAALVGAVYVPVLNNLLGTVPLAFNIWFYVVAVGMFNLILIELAKYYFISRNKVWD